MTQNPSSYSNSASLTKFQSESAQKNGLDEEREGPPPTQKSIPNSVAFLWGSFLYEGLFLPGENNTYRRRVISKSSSDCIDLVMHSLQYAEEVWMQIEKHWPLLERSDARVFEYEVISPLGTYISEHIIENNGKTPELEVVGLKIEQLIYDFLNS